MHENSRWRPSLLFGLGAFGIKSIEPIISQRQRSDPVVGYGIGFADYTNDKMQYCQLSTDIHQFCREYPQPWFDPTLLQQSFNSNDRRWVRAAFLYEQVTSGSIAAFLIKQLTEFNLSLNIYMVTNFEDPESACLLDFAYLIQSIAYLHKATIRLRAYVVLDTTIGFKTFAALREIVRIETSDMPLDLHQHIPHRYKVTHDEIMRLFAGFYVFQATSERQRRSAQYHGLRQVVTDTLRTSVEETFGTSVALIDDNIEESKAHERPNLHPNEAYFVGVRQANLLKIPVLNLKEHMRARLIKGLLTNWLGGDEKDLAARAQSLLLDWAKNQLRNPVDKTVLIGTSGIPFVDNCILAAYEDSFSLLAEDLFTMDAFTMLRFYNFEPNGFAMDSTPTSWSPKYATLEDLPSGGSGGITYVKNMVIHGLESYVGELEYLSQEETAQQHRAQRNGLMLSWMQSVNAKYLAQFSDNLRMFIDYVLATAGLLPLLQVLRQLEQVLSDADDMLIEVLFRRINRTQSSLPRPLSALKRVSAEMTALRRPAWLGGGIHPTLASFLNLADEIRDSLAIECSFLARQDLLQVCKVQVHDAIEYFMQWEETLYRHRNSVWYAAHDAVEASDIRQQQWTGWLLSESWLIEEEIDAVARIKKQAQIGWTRDWQPHVEGQALLSVQHIHWSDANWRIIKDYVDRFLNQHQQKWTVWNYLFSEHATQNSVQAITDALTQTPLCLDLTIQLPQEWHYYFVHPSTSSLPNELAKQVEYYAQAMQTANADYAGIAGLFSSEISSLQTDIFFFIAADLVPISHLAGYQQWQANYTAQHRVEQVHIFTAEMQAARYERKLRLRRQLHNTVVALLEYLQEWPHFMWGVATQFITLPMDDSYISAFKSFLSSLAAESLTHADVQRAVDEDIRKHIENGPPPQSKVWHWAMTLSDAYRDDAMRNAMAYDIVDAFIERVQLVDFAHNQAEQDFVSILLDIAKDERSARMQAVRRLVP